MTQGHKCQAHAQLRAVPVETMQRLQAHLVNLFTFSSGRIANTLFSAESTSLRDRGTVQRQFLKTCASLIDVAQAIASRLATAYTQQQLHVLQRHVAAASVYFVL